MANETFDSVWDAIADSPEEAVALKTKSDLMREVVKLAHNHRKGLRKLGLACGLPEKSIIDIEQGRFARVDIFDLFKLAAALGYQVDIQLRAKEKSSTS